ncbi:MAG TPA: carbamoyltransferase HypF, partial [Pseudorhodoferax sp.]|nr:carbamoyltransferase HypF [Pseudorhodoferax sp.]
AQGVRRVVLGGGCFFNPILRERVQAALAAQDLQVLQAGSRGCGDAALAWGQAWVATRQLQALATHEETSACA